MLKQLFGMVYLPRAVASELANGPDAVRAWIAAPPDWLVVREPTTGLVHTERLDPGEAAAIALAEDLKADALLVDDRDGRRAAAERGLLVIGTLGILDRAAGRGLVDLPTAVGRLLATNFHVRPGLINDLLARHGRPQP